MISGVSSGVTDFVDGLFPAADGPVLLTSPTVFIGGLPAARAGIDLVACVKHSVPPLIAEGSDSITIEGFPAARINDKVACGAALKQGITTVMLGGEKVQMVKIDDEFAWWQKGILIAIDYLIPPSNCLKQGLCKLPGALLKGGKNLGNLLKSGSKTVASLTKSAGKYLATKGKAAWNAALAGIRKGAQVAADAMKSLRAQLGKLKGALKSLWAGTCGKCKPKKRKAIGDKPGTNKPDAKACKNDPAPTLVQRLERQLGIRERSVRLVLGEVNITFVAPGRLVAIDLRTSSVLWRRERVQAPVEAPEIWFDPAVEFDANGDVETVTSWDPEARALMLRFMGGVPERWFEVAKNAYAGVDTGARLCELMFMDVSEGHRPVVA